MPQTVSKKTPFNWSDDDQTIQQKIKQNSLQNLSISSIKKDEHWNIIKNKRRNTKNICCHYFYEGFCSINNCSRIHTHNLSHLQQLFGHKFKSKPCSNGYFCKHAVCIFNHPIDNYILHFNNKTILNGNIDKLRKIRNKNRHIAYIKEGNPCNIHNCPFC
jgi:hypothetical protein